MTSGRVQVNGSYFLHNPKVTASHRNEKISKTQGKIHSLASNKKTAKLAKKQKYMTHN